MDGQKLDKWPLRHHSFILTLWQERDDPFVWRFSLEDPHNSVRHGFKDAVALTQFLTAWTAIPPSDELSSKH